MTNSDDLEARLTQLDEEFSEQVRALLNAMDGAFDRTNDLINRNAQAIEQLGTRIDRLAESQQTMQMTMSQVMLLMAQSIEQANRDRAEFREEIRRIWQHLLRQQPNGHGEAE